MATDINKRDNLQEVLKTMPICRFCLCTKRLTSIFAKDAKIASLAPLTVQVMACASIEIFTNDGMPSLICQECRLLFEHSYRFKQMCKRADTLLRQYPLTGQWPKPLERPKIPQCLVASSPNAAPASTTIINNQLITTTNNNNALPTQAKKILNSTPSIAPEPPVPMRFTFKTEPNQDDMQIDLADKVNNNSELTMEDVQKIIANAGDEDFIIDDNYTPAKSAPKVLNCAPKRILNKDLNKDNEPQFSRPKVQRNQNGKVEIVTAIVQPNKDVEKTNPLKVAEPVATDNFPCPFCDRSFPLLQLRDIHLTRHNRERNFQCPDCDKSFFSKYDLQKHEVRHTGEKPFKCHVCDKSFSRMTLLHRHEQVHTDVPKFLCMYCEKPFISKDELEIHIARHEKNRPFKCNKCGKSFAFKQGLERHESVHSAVQPYPCQYCNESFGTPSKLSRHLTAHAGDRPFPCKYCNKLYLLSHHLTRHLRSHKEFKSSHDCSECQKVFKTREELIYHTAVHSTANKICTLCQLKFQTIEEISVHIKLHIEGDTYACEFCDSQFITADDLFAHYDQKHTNEVEEFKYANQAQEDNLSSKSTNGQEEEGDINNQIFEINIKRQRRQHTMTVLDGDDENVMATINEILNTEDMEEDAEFDVKHKSPEKPKILNQVVISSENVNNNISPTITQQNVRNENNDEASIAKRRKVIENVGESHVVVAQSDVVDQVTSNSVQRRKIAEKPPIEIKVEKDDSPVSKVVLPKGITLRRTTKNNENDIQSIDLEKIVAPNKNTQRFSLAEAKAVVAEKRAKETEKTATSPTRTMSTRRTAGNTLKNKTELPTSSKQPPKVKQIRMTKAMADELTKQGRIRFKDGNMILTKPGKR